MFESPWGLACKLVSVYVGRQVKVREKICQHTGYLQSLLFDHVILFIPSDAFITLSTLRKCICM